MPITITEVLEVLNDWRLRKLRFSVGPVDINTFEYGQVADAMKAGAIAVKPGKGKISIYYPELSKLVTKGGDPPMNLNTRTNLLHECTHAISDVNELKITRLHDEAAAYLAQIAYLMLLDPDIDEPPIGPAINNMMRQSMKLVAKYKLGEPAGLGARIAQTDIESLARLVHAIPDYSDLGEKEMLNADGVWLTEAEKKEFLRLQAERMGNGLLDEAIAEDVKQLLNPVRTVAFENYVTDDDELLGLCNAFAKGDPAKKEAAVQKMTYIFLKIDKRSALELQQRLPAAKKGDVVALRFQAVFPPPKKAALLEALKVSR